MRRRLYRLEHHRAGLRSFGAPGSPALGRLRGSGDPSLNIQKAKQSQRKYVIDDETNDWSDVPHARNKSHPVPAACPTGYNRPLNGILKRLVATAATRCGTGRSMSEILLATPLNSQIETGINGLDSHVFWMWSLAWEV